MLKRSPIFAVLFALFSVITVVAQLSSCPQLVENALNAIGDNCGELSRNSACYGYNRVEASFTTEVTENFFSTPSDRAQLTDLATLRTYPLDTVNEEWGVAVMNIQANLPNTVPGQGVLMMLVGDAEIRNDVPAADATTIGDPISTVTLAETNLYSSPSSSSEIIGNLPVNAVVLIDGVNTTRSWLRVVTDGTISWVERDSLARLAAMDTLPVIGASTPAPMQAFYLSTGIGTSDCSEADPVIAVQSPEHITVDLTVNGVDIRVGSLITFQNVGQNTVNLTVHRGEVSSVFGNTIQAGQSALGVIDPDAEGATIVEWGEPVQASDYELALGESVQQAVNNVARNNGWDERSIEPTSEPEPVTEQSGELIHIVAAGENLFRIGRLYDANLPEIVARNGLQEPYTLFVGQELIIPNPGSGFVNVPTPNRPVIVVDQPDLPEFPVDQPLNGCATLRLTSPLTSVPTEAHPFYWDGVAGATQYQVNIFDQATGLLMGTILTNGTETTVTISVGQLGVGGGMQWQVVALLNGVPICSSGLSQPLLHGAPLEQPDDLTEKDGFSISWNCNGYYSVQVSWKDANEDELVDFTIRDNGGNSYSVDKRGESGSFSVTGVGYNFTSADGVTESGERDRVTGNLFCT